MAPRQLAPGDFVQLTLFWQTDSRLADRYKVFVHLYADPSQPPLAQQDGEPQGGQAPTTTWEPEATVHDNHGVLIPADLPPGDYTLMIGLYDLFTNDRLPVTIDGTASGDRLSLGTLTVR